MSTKSTSFASDTISRATEPTAAQRAWHADIQSRLSKWFAAAFELVDGNTGETLTGNARHVTDDALVRAELCRAVAAGGKAEFIEEIEPLVVLAIPVAGDDQHRVVAVATFNTCGTVGENQVRRVARILNIAPEAARRWITAQNSWQPPVLLNMGQLAAERLAAECRLRALDRDVRDLTLNLSTTYEEISLIYRLTQNLKLGSQNEELAALAIEWLSDVVPAECLAVQLIQNTPTGDDGQLAEPRLLTYGDCPINSDDLTDILAAFELTPSKRPLIVNDVDALQMPWHWPEVRQLVAVSLCEGANCFGWLLAINHSAGGEFGTVEASLLSSIGAILGIHGGNAKLYQEQHELFKGMVRALTSAIDAKDPYTCGHSERVARISVRLAEELGCNRTDVDTIYLSGLLHDVGKIGIDDQVLRKPGKLTDAEYEHIKTHATIGHRILSDIKQLDHVLPVVRHHHEQWNGKGYPDGLAGEAIPLLARIVAVADSFDAMGSDRPYRAGMPDEKLDAIFREGAGAQWDSQVIDAFFRARNDLRAIAARVGMSAMPDAREFT
jgi:putative nucleotidyltransferase with HDIG domain